MELVAQSKSPVPIEQNFNVRFEAASSESDKSLEYNTKTSIFISSNL